MLTVTEIESEIRKKLDFNEISLQDLCTEIMRARAVDLMVNHCSYYYVNCQIFVLVNLTNINLQIIVIILQKDTMETVRRSYWMEQSKNPYDKIMKQLDQGFDKIVRFLTFVESELDALFGEVHDDKLPKPSPSNVRDRPSFSPFRHLKALDRYVEGK